MRAFFDGSSIISKSPSCQKDQAGMSNSSTENEVRRPAGIGETVKAIRKRLRRGQYANIDRLVEVVAPTTDALEHSFDFLVALFKAEGHEQKFLDFLMTRPDLSLGRLSLAAKVISFAGELGLEQTVVDWIVSQPPTNLTRWSLGDRTRGIAASPAARKALIHLKYGVGPVETAKDLIQRADDLYSRIDFPLSELDRLYEVARDREVPVALWRKQVVGANVINQMLKELVPAGRHSRFIAADRRRSAFERIAGPLVLFSFHGSFLPLLHAAFKAQFEDGHPLGVVTATQDARAALFTGLRLLQEKKVVALAPDGSEGLNIEIEVLGSRSMIGEGAAFLAYEGKCPAAWFTIAREDDAFVPVVIPFPERQSGEKYRQFKERFAQFYTERVSDAFTGDPRNLVRTPRWGHLFRETWPLGELVTRPRPAAARRVNGDAAPAQRQ
ncbi:MAG: hypothetical protein HQ465_26480 [Rhodospirillales bacterium]|nr:hypothetical protein [Rhodospirillales bacterium]